MPADEKAVRDRLARLSLEHTRRRVMAALHCRPLPLIDEQLRLAVLFSAKAGCKYVVRWFFSQTGELEKAKAHSPWIHDYRAEVRYCADGYRTEALLGPHLRAVKFVRNPYERAVSSYIHAVRSAYGDDRVQLSVGRALSDEERFSFREFVGYFESSSLTALDCDPHHRSQIHETERLGIVRPARVVRIEEASDSVPQMEHDLGLRRTDYQSLRRSGHHTERIGDDTPCADRAHWTGRDGQLRTRFPATHCFYDDELLDRVRTLYHEDFARYGYDPTEVPSPPAP